MKKLILLLIAFVVGILAFQRINKNDLPSENLLKKSKIISVNGRVSGNLTVLGESVFKMISHDDTSKTYYVVTNGNAPAIGDELRNLKLVKYDLFILNDDTVAIYRQMSKKD